MTAQPLAQKRRSPAQIVSDWWQAWTGFNPAYSDLSCCAQEDVNRIAHDIGISPAELRELSKLGPDAADQLLQRMQALHLDPDAVADAEPPTFQDLQRLCSTCNEHKRCQQDFARHAEARDWEQLLSQCRDAEGADDDALAQAAWGVIRK